MEKMLLDASFQQPSPLAICCAGLLDLGWIAGRQPIQVPLSSLKQDRISLHNMQHALGSLLTRPGRPSCNRRRSPECLSSFLQAQATICKIGRNSIPTVAGSCYKITNSNDLSAWLKPTATASRTSCSLARPNACPHAGWTSHPRDGHDARVSLTCSEPCPQKALSCPSCIWRCHASRVFTAL